MAMIKRKYCDCHCRMKYIGLLSDNGTWGLLPMTEVPYESEVMGGAEK